MSLFRAAVAGPRGAEVERIVELLDAGRWTLGGETITRAPRGYPADHPRIGLLRHKSFYVNQEYGDDPVVATAELGETVREDWRELRPLVEWLAHTFGGAARS